MNKREKEVLLYELEQEKKVLKKIEGLYEKALKSINVQIAAYQANAMSESQKNRLAYQQNMKQQVTAVLDKLHSDEFQTIDQFVNASYTTGYVGTMYNLAGQGIPVIMPIDNNAVVKAVLTDSKIKTSMYEAIGVDVNKLKKTIPAELTRGIASGATYDRIAKRIEEATGAPMKRAQTIVRTEAHRVQEASQEDARQAAKSRGADVVKQWDATLDSRTRETHAMLDGQIRETDEPFEIDGKKAMYPGDFGDPAEDCNCRCVALTRARWALDEEELKTMEERAAFFGLDKTDNFEDFKKKYLNTTEPLKKQEKSDKIDTGKTVSRNMSDVSTGGKRNEEPLTSAQIHEAEEAAKKQGYNGEIKYSNFINTSFHGSTDGESYHYLVIGTDAYPASINGGTANENVSLNGCMAHEIVGHYEAWRKGTTKNSPVLEEAQASIRASKFGVGLTDEERAVLYQDGIDRLKNAGIELKDVENTLDIWER